MVFPTLAFLLFFLAVWPHAWIAVWMRAHTLHKLTIIVASYVFYAFWDWRFVFLLLSSVLLNWGTARLIDRGRGTGWAKLWVTLGVAINLLLLGLFKYYGWFSTEMNALLRAAGLARDIPLMEILLPVGISFFTFQGISYIVDLHRGDLDRARPLVDVMFFISFFPHLVAGPIVRAASFLPQLERMPRPNRVFVGLGVMLILWGVFKKAVIAHWLAVELVDKVFFDPVSYGTLDAVAAVYGYAVQIYCDFSAYSDIAIGIAALLGYRFQRNFNQPYRAETLADFWRRWHMSLSSWLRDYLYVPLGGNRGGRIKTYRNLLLTMVLGGIWHGAAWKFVIWGALHGGFLALERAMSGRRGDVVSNSGVSDLPPPLRGGVGGGVATRATSQAIRHTVSPHPQPLLAGEGGAVGEMSRQVPQTPMWMRALRVLLIFHFVCFCWIFFRAENVGRAVEMLAALARPTISTQLVSPWLMGLIAFGLVIQFTPSDLIERLDRVYQRLPVVIVGLLAAAVLLAIELIGGDETATFIYFQF